MDTASKRGRERALIAEMIALYCRKNHGAAKLCPDCAKLLCYAEERTDRCPYMQTKTFCSSCRTHCYAPEMRKSMRAVMRYSGPRIAARHPLLVLKHACCSRKRARDTVV